MKLEREAMACFRTSSLSFEMSALVSSCRPEMAMVSAASVAAHSTSTMRQFTVDVTFMMMLSAEVA